MFEPFPRPPGGVKDPAVRLLFQTGKERITGITGTSLVLTHAPIDGSLLLTKNSVVVDVDNPLVCSLSGKTITLVRAAVADDVFIAYYHYRQIGG